MPTTLTRHFRQLAQRRSANLEVTLLWNRRSCRTWISIYDHGSDKQHAVRVPPEQALDAFNHPFAYLPAYQPVQPT